NILEPIVVIIPVDPVAVHIIIDIIPVRDSLLPNALVGQKGITGGHHGLQPLHVGLGTDHPVTWAAFGVHRAIGQKVGTDARISVRYVVFIDKFPFHGTSGIVHHGGHVTDIGMIAAVAIVIAYPACTKGPFKFGDPVVVGVEVGGYAIIEILDFVPPTQVQIQTGIGHLCNILVGR